MKYNYLERYNLIEIIQELETATGLTKKNIDEYLSNFKKIDINSEKAIKVDFEALKNGSNFFKTFNKEVTLYYFFFEEKLYCVKLFVNNSLKMSDFSFFASEHFYKNNIDFFINNYKNWDYFNLKAKKLNDTKIFWLKIGAIIKSHSEEFKIKYFQFSGADTEYDNKPSLDSIKYATKNSFESCRTYLKANLLQLDNSKNTNKNSLDIINKYIDEKTIFFIEDASWFNLQYDSISFFIKKRNKSLLNLESIIKKSFEDICKDFEFNLNKKKKNEIQTLKTNYEQKQQLLLNKLQSLNFFKKEISIFNTFLKNLNELQAIVSEIKHNSIIKKQNLVVLYKILNKINIQIILFKKSLEIIENNEKNIIKDYDKLIVDIKKNASSEKIIEPLTAEIEEILSWDFERKIQEFNYKVINLISLYIYKNEITREIRKNKNSKNILSTKDIIKRFEMLLNDIIKKYKLDKNIINQLIEIKNSLIPQFDDIKSYKAIKREIFAKILTETLQQVSNIEKTFILHEDYKNRLELYIKSINDKVFKNKSNFLNFIEELKFDPQYSYFDFKKLPNPIECVGWLLSYTEEGKMALMNAREKRYYNILINDLRIPKEDIIFKNGNIIFKI